MGICRLLEENGFAAAFPLHDGQFDLPQVQGNACFCKKKVQSSEQSLCQRESKQDGSTPPVLNRRQVLHQYWARWGCWFKYQPLDHIREYFGERIAIYFAWLGFYTGWLLPAALVGLAVFLYGLVFIIGQKAFLSTNVNILLPSSPHPHYPGMATLDENVIAQEVCNEQARK